MQSLEHNTGSLFDVRVYHPNAPSYCSKDLATVFRQHESANTMKGYLKWNLVSIPIGFYSSGCMAERLQHPTSVWQIWTRVNHIQLSWVGFSVSLDLLRVHADDD